MQRNYIQIKFNPKERIPTYNFAAGFLNHLRLRVRKLKECHGNGLLAFMKARWMHFLLPTKPLHKSKALHVNQKAFTMLERVESSNCLKRQASTERCTKAIQVTNAEKMPQQKIRLVAVHP
jgi:hypothetical protein